MLRIKINMTERVARAICEERSYAGKIKTIALMIVTLCTSCGGVHKW
jgi:hypothetical protein